MEDKIIKCVDCGKEFIFSISEQEWFLEKGFKAEPKRDKNCRKIKRERFGNSYSQTENSSNDYWRGK